MAFVPHSPPRETGNENVIIFQRKDWTNEGILLIWENERRSPPFVGTGARQLVPDTTMVMPNKTDRVVRVRKLYVTDAEGEPDVRASSDKLVHIARLEFEENGHVIDLDMDELQDQYPNWYRAAACFGALTAAANAATSAKDDAGNRADLTTMIDAAEDRANSFRSGEWSAETRTGPRTADLVAAYVASRKARNVTVSQDRQDALKAALLDGSMTAKGLCKDPGVELAYEQIKAQRAVDRANATAERLKAKGAVEVDLDSQF